MDSVSLKEIQNRLLQWESHDNPLAQLTPSQREAIQDLENIINGTTDDNESADQKSEIPDVLSELDSMNIESTNDFLEFYEQMCYNDIKKADAPYEAYYSQLEERKNECDLLLNQIDATMDNLNKLNEQYNFVSDKTSALHVMSEQLLADQNKLSAIGEEIKSKLYFFNQVEHLSQRINSPTMSVNSEAFFAVLAKIDECLEYMKANPHYKESHSYMIKYRHLQSRAINLIRSYVSHVFNHATEQILSPDNEDKSTDTAYAVYFGKFQAAAPKIKMVIEEIEKRSEWSEDYASFLSDIQREYASHRARVSVSPVSLALSATNKCDRDHCTLLRTSCSLLAHACRDECALYAHFFTKPSQALDDYLRTLCNSLYEMLRPQIIHINHLETLAEICVILRVEIIEEQCDNEPQTLSALSWSARSLLQDAQERLVFRAHVRLRADVLNYRPAAGDLAYPDKLELMAQIAQSIQEQQSLKRTDSRSSVTSEMSSTSQEVANLTDKRQNASPADMHGMWYPGVRRTLAALSRLYRCLEKRVFQGLAQEAISYCVQSISSAAKQISENQTNIDGQLFEIKHLLILREQIAPFQVDFVVKETSLDFSNVKNAAYGLINTPKRLFSLSSNNALLEFLLEGTPLVKEHLLDSRKEVDRQLKGSCEAFIKEATELLCGPMVAVVDKMQKFDLANQLSSQPWATAMRLSEVVTESQRRIKSHLAPFQRSMQLYLANKETEFILFRPIRNNVVGYFVQLEQLLTSGNYTTDDILIVACPSPEQISVIISSASLISHGDVLPYGKKRKTSVVQKPSIASIVEKDRPKSDA